MSRVVVVSCPVGFFCIVWQRWALSGWRVWVLLVTETPVTWLEVIDQTRIVVWVAWGQEQKVSLFKSSKVEVEAYHEYWIGHSEITFFFFRNHYNLMLSQPALNFVETHNLSRQPCIGPKNKTKQMWAHCGSSHTPNGPLVVISSLCLHRIQLITKCSSIIGNFVLLCQRQEKCLLRSSLNQEEAAAGASWLSGPQVPSPLPPSIQMEFDESLIGLGKHACRGCLWTQTVILFPLVGGRALSSDKSRQTRSRCLVTSSKGAERSITGSTAIYQTHFNIQPHSFDSQDYLSKLRSIHI